jgi:hypothetical protein
MGIVSWLVEWWYGRTLVGLFFLMALVVPVCLWIVPCLSLVSGNVPTKHSSNRALGRWVSTQRSQHKKHQRGVPCHLTQDRIDKLDELDFIWRMAPAKNDDANTNMLLHPDNRLMGEEGEEEEEEDNEPPEDDGDEEEV